MYGGGGGTMRLKIGVIQLLHSALRYEVKVYKGNSDHAIFGWSEPTTEYTLGFLIKHKEEIESVEYWANASPVPPEALAKIERMKEICTE